MKIFITGHKGFIGSEICRQSRALGHEIMGLEKPNRMENPPWDELKAFQPDACIHAAWIATPGEYTTSPLNKSHYLWSLQLIRGLIDLGTSGFVVLGTCAEYAPASVPLLEDTSLELPESPYAEEKHRLHQELKNIFSDSEASLAWARIFYPYGPGEHPGRLISQIIQSRREGKSLQLNNPMGVRDYIHVEDVASALLLCCQRRYHGSINIGTGRGIVLGDLGALIGLPGGVMTARMNIANSLPADSVVADIGKLKALGWRPRHGIESGLRTYSKI